MRYPVKVYSAWRDDGMAEGEPAEARFSEPARPVAQPRMLALARIVSKIGAPLVLSVAATLLLRLDTSGVTEPAQADARTSATGAPPISPAADAPAQQAPAEQRVKIDNFTYSPRALTVTAGTKVTWVNDDDIPHTATSAQSPPIFNSGTLDTDGTFSFTFEKKGTYPYFCGFHPHMTGTITVQ